MRRFAAVLGLFGCLSLAACGTDSVDSQAAADVVVTKPTSSSFDFANAATFSLPTSVPLITDPQNPTNGATWLNAETQARILQDIKTNMESRGYTQVTADAGGKPDMVIEVSVLSSTTTQVYYDYWYPYWGSYYAPYYGSFYATGYAPYVDPTIINSTVGSILINMTDANHPDTVNKKIPTIWVAAVAGPTTNASSAEVLTRIDSGINQAFTQSPYLRRSGSGN